MIGPLHLLRAIGARELGQLATPAGAPVIPGLALEALIAGGCGADATADQLAAAATAIDTTLQPVIAFANAAIGRIGAGRTLSADEQTLLDTYACDIARYRLYDDASLPEDHPVRKRYEAAIRFIERVASGLEALGTAPLGTAGNARATEGERQFTRDTLAAY